MSELVRDSLEACAELDVDITDAVYQRFFATDKAAAELMGHADQYMRGRMLQEVVELLISEDDADYLKWEVTNHLLSYAVDESMYTTFFNAVQAAVADGLGAQWTPAYAQAWRVKTTSLLDAIQVLAAKPA